MFLSARIENVCSEKIKNITLHLPMQSFYFNTCHQQSFHCFNLLSPEDGFSFIFTVLNQTKYHWNLKECFVVDIQIIR